MHSEQKRPYAAIFRTHVWDTDVAAMAQRARAACTGGEFVVAADETRGELSIEGFSKIGHNDNFTSLGLPRWPADRTLWWNADYVLYAVRMAMPGHEYYVMLEYDVFVSSDVDRLVTHCAANGIDLIVHDPKQIGADNLWFASIRDMGGEAWWALLPFMIVSGRAIDAMLATRRAIAAELIDDRAGNWPYCEAFIPTVVQSQPGMVVAPLSRFVDARLVRYRPFMSVRDPALRREGIVAHPVLIGRRFIQAFADDEPEGALLMSDGALRPELALEDRNDLVAVLTERLHTLNDIDRHLAVARAPIPPQLGVFDLAYSKPATQSSHSIWSRGQTAAEDARGAIGDTLFGDYAFHTGADDETWWQVDLGKECRIEAIEIVNREAVPHNFKRFRIDASLDETCWITRFEKSDGTMVSSDALRPAVFRPIAVFVARYIRIVQLGNRPMHLRRIRVLGVPLAMLWDATPAGIVAMMREPTVATSLAATIVDVIKHQMLGQVSDSFNVDSLAFLAAGLDSSLYVTANMTGVRRLNGTLDLLDFAAGFAPANGMILEFGVYSGRTINRLAACFPGKTVHGFDSFEGLPEDWRPGFGHGAFRRPAPPVVAANVDLVVGWFNDTLPVFVEAHPGEAVALLHVDCDLYSSTQTVFAALQDRIVNGTIIVFDEYFNYPGWRGHEYLAFQEFIAAHGIAYEYIGLVPSHQQVAVRILRAGAG